jgi:spermidine/putrescine-binding protein
MVWLLRLFPLNINRFSHRIPHANQKAGHFRAFWENFGQSVNLMVNGEVVLECMWSLAVAAIQADHARRVRYACG